MKLKLDQQLVGKYAEISYVNHLIVCILILLLFNWLITTFNLSMYVMYVCLGIIIALTILRNLFRSYDVTVVLNDTNHVFENVKVRIDKKTKVLKIVDKHNQLTIINQGNWTITPHGYGNKKEVNQQ